MNPITMSVVNCNINEMVECSGLKPYWSGAGRRYVLMVCIIKVFGTFEIWTLYEVHYEVFLPGLGIGMINKKYHIAGI